MRFCLSILLVVNLIAACAAGELVTPKAIVESSGSAFPQGRIPGNEPDPQYAADKTIDGKPETYCCLLDDSQTGANDQTIPPRGSKPVTGRILFDLGTTRQVFGVRLTARQGGGSYYGPSNIDLFYRDDSGAAKDAIRDIDVERISNGAQTAVACEPIKARYVGIRVNDSYESAGIHFNFQLAEVRFYCSDEAENADGTKKHVSHADFECNGTTLDQVFEQQAIRNQPDDLPFPAYRLKRDWQYQDFGVQGQPFTDNQGNAVEKAALEKILAELGNSPSAASAIANFRSAFNQLVEGKVPAVDPRWTELYYRLCEARRAARLKPYFDQNLKILYTKHFVIGGPVHYSFTEEVTDNVRVERSDDWRMGAKICQLTLSPDGAIAQETVRQTESGTIRDPGLSYDGRQLVFSQRDNSDSDDLHLYVMDLQTRQTRQITFGTGYADIEPAFLPNGEIVFASTRCGQYVDCWWADVSNLYVCDDQGRYLRRWGFDQVTTNYPQVLNDGRIIYTRWEYNDRGQIYPQPLFVMNPDGTGQTEYYGNNSWFPTTILHARAVPGSQKVIAVSSGHHNHQRGKLIMIDRTKGTQEASGITYLAPERPAQAVRVDVNDQHGETFQYPYAFDENNYLVTYNPEGYGVKGPYQPPFGIYWMDKSGRRELLAFDPAISCSQSIPVLARSVPSVKPTTVDLNRDSGTFYVQDVYQGPGLEGIPRGTIKRLRVVATEYRAVGVSHAYNRGEAGQSHATTPVAINNGSWDVKHILGSVEVGEDGSALFEVPARTPVYFQLLDDKGRCVQTMRSWATLQPGEFFSCVGCHEDKNTTFSTDKNKLVNRTPKQLESFYAADEAPVSESAVRYSGEEKAVARYLTINAPHGNDYPQGFSYIRDVQPIWDAQCVDCHSKGQVRDGKSVPLSLRADQANVTLDCLCVVGGDQDTARRFSESYIELTRGGKINEIVNWISAQSRPDMLPPYFAGSAKSRLMDYLEPTHYNVQVTDEQKRAVAAWIDLLIPFCGSYMEANLFDSKTSPYDPRFGNRLEAVYRYHEAKRAQHAVIELDHLKKYREWLETGTACELSAFPLPAFGGLPDKGKFVENWYKQRTAAPIWRADGFDKNESSARNLALNPTATVAEVSSFPYASTNSHFRYVPRFSPAQAIDGNPETYWRPLRQADAWLKLEFGRTVEISRVTVRLKPAADTENAWTKATVRFLDAGGKEVGYRELPLKTSSEPQTIEFAPTSCAAIVVSDFASPLPPRDAGIAELECVGTEGSESVE